MQNYHLDLVWKIDKALFMLLGLLVFSIIIYVFVQELLFKIRRKSLLKIKNGIYELLLQKKGKSVCSPGSGELTSRQFIDVLTNRSRWAAFFNEEEQDQLRRCFINQDNIVKIERVARNSRSKWRRIEAMLALGLAEASNSLAILEKGLFDKDPEISYFSLLALGRIKTDLSLRILLAFLKKNSLRRKKTASILEHFPPSAVELIIGLTDDPDPDIRFWAVKILSRFKPVEYTGRIKALCKDADANVRAAACECLGSIGGREVQEELLRRMGDDSWIVRVQAGRGLWLAAGEDCLPHIVRLLSDNSLNVVEAARDILTRDTGIALPYLEKLLTGDDDLARKKAIEIMATCGFVQKLVRGLLADDGSGPHQMKLIAALIGSGAHFSIESAVLGLGLRERTEIIGKMKNMDEDFARHLLLKSRDLEKKHE